jgi:hypothetical protein
LRRIQIDLEAVSISSWKTGTLIGLKNLRVHWPIARQTNDIPATTITYKLPDGGFPLHGRNIGTSRFINRVRGDLSILAEALGAGEGKLAAIVVKNLSALRACG